MKYSFTGINKQDRDADRLEVADVPAGVRILLSTHTTTSGFFDPADAPAMALAILKAAGYGGKGDYVLVNAINTAVACIENHIENVERNAKTEVLTRRRDELARELNGGGIDAAYDTYAGQPMPIRTAIDRIIELEPTP